MLDIPAINSDLPQTIFHGKLHCFAQIDSTNSKAMAEALAGAEEGSTYIAEEQTSGRGRGGHAWHSEPGSGIYLSTILRPRLQANDILWVSLFTGLAVRAAVEEVSSLSPDLRWPNDLLLGKKKFCGILAEMNSQRSTAAAPQSGQPDSARFVVVGIGLNVNHSSFSPELSPIATSLRIETGRQWLRESLITALLQSLHREYREFAQAGPGAGGASIRRRFEAASSYGRGKRVLVEEGGGYTGVTEGLDERGFLRIRTESGLRTVLSGGVHEMQDYPA